MLVCDGLEKDSHCYQPTNCIPTQNNICSTCLDGGYLLNNTCFTCPDNCRQCNASECFQCGNTFTLEGGRCIPQTSDTPFAISNHVLKCEVSHFVDNNECRECSSNCASCTNTSVCSACTDSVNDGTCHDVQHATGLTNNGILSCEDGYVIQGKECVRCSTVFDSACSHCSSSECLACSTGVLTAEKTCYLSCSSVIDGHCTCPDDLFFNGSLCTSCGEHCTHCDGETCVSCDDGFVLDAHSNSCSPLETPVSTVNSHGAPLRCIGGFFLNTTQRCDQCTSCATCLSQADFCLACDGNASLVEHVCVPNSEAMRHCKQAIPNSGGCAICNDGFFREETSCSTCQAPCRKCTSSGCSLCVDTHWLQANTSECVPKSLLTNCTSVTADGCDACQDGFFVQDQMCASCSSRSPGCTLCGASGECFACEDAHVLHGDACLHYSDVANCQEAHGSRCTRCSFWHRPTPAGDACTTRAVWWVVLLIILLIALVCLAVLIWAINWSLKHVNRRSSRQKVRIFDIRKTNTAFLSLGGG